MEASGFVTCAALGLAAGYYLGRQSNPPVALVPDSKPETVPVPSIPTTEAALTAAKEDSDDEGADGDGDLASVTPGLFEECKMVLVVRSDLGMTRGKIAAQCGHATLACYKTLQKSNPALLAHWERIGQAKVALKCDSEDELLLLQATAQSLNLCARTIQDAGRTQIAAGSTTVLGIGPGPVKLVNQVTGKLKLL
ncbi:hypothetical protein M407DRAFT_240569 [Tulasnella calospora MUT 4182]|uniref:peptidyl-tRNA hydrolase n=1 Tax=Tulasnella calospora MUT 4182 TaxID=1051891 RepID=A0A0C3QXF8_9AGAM|nr:hypothetical protein M407DRAFT_240569 [Tulasnella calospora MUT 4182]